MALIRWLGENEPWKALDRMQREAERWFGANWPTASFGARVYPAMNIYDDGESFIVRAEVPGVDPKDIEVTVTGDTLTVRGKREIRAADESCCYHRRERSSGTFRRAFTLPEQVDNTKVNAETKDGVLEIRLPRAEQAKTRKVEVKAN